MVGAKNSRDYFDWDVPDDMPSKPLERCYIRDLHDLVRGCLVAGRAETFHKTACAEGQLILDVKSLYPSVLGFAGNEQPGTTCKDILGFEPVYPYGPITAVKQQNPNLLGVYYCRINQSDPKKKNVIPYRATIYKRSIKVDGMWFKLYKAEQGKQLDWKYKKPFYAYLNTVDILSVREAFGFEAIKVIQGIEWKAAARGVDVFPFIKYWKDVKNQQDDLKTISPEKYNPALRECSKLFQNCLTGRVIM